MDEKNHKQKLHIKFKQINDWLTIREINLGIDKELSEDNVIYFNGFMTEEGFEYEILETELPQLLSELEEFEFYELDQTKLKEMKKHMAKRILNFVSDPFDDLIFNDKLAHLEAEHVDSINRFIEKQIELRQIIADKLLEGLDDTSSKAKKFVPIVWNGTQTELAELFKVLMRKKWINEPQNKTQFVNTLCQMFSIENEQTANKNILDYYYRPEKYIADNHFSDIDPSPIKK